MNRTNWQMAAASLLAFLFLMPLGCDDGETGGDGQNQGEDPDRTAEDTVAPTVALDGLTPYLGVRGITKVSVAAADNADVVSVELLVGGEVAAEKTDPPFVFDWDTSQSNDGPIDLSARATDTSGNQASSDVVRVVIINEGVEVLDLEGGELVTMAIPADYDGTQETHVKRHYTPEEHYIRALCVGLWHNPLGGSVWEMKAEMGTGTCPHNGISFEGSGLSETGAVEFDSMPPQGIAKDERHFCHIGAENADLHKGEQVEITYKVFLFAEQVDLASCPLNSAFPCRCDGVEQCEDGSDCVGFLPDQNGGACAKLCDGEEDTASCSDTQGFGLFGFCGASKVEGPTTHCLVVCEDNGQSGSCPPDLDCEMASGVCLPAY